MAEKRDNNGALFKNDRKEQDKHPDYTGSATVDGIDYYVSAWVKPPSGKATSKWMSIAFTRKDGKVAINAPTKNEYPDTGGDDDMPF